jgi:hypothetical protein
LGEVVFEAGGWSSLLSVPPVPADARAWDEAADDVDADA